MTKTEIIPSQDALFNDYVVLVSPYLLDAGNAARLGISSGNQTTLDGNTSKWSKNWKLYTDPTQKTTLVTKNKSKYRKDLVATLRSIYNDIPRSALTEADRQILNLKERDTTGTRVNAVDYAPVISIEGTTHLQHTLRFSDPKNPTSNAMPDGQKVVLESFVGTSDAKVADIAFANDKNITRFLAQIGFTDGQVAQTCYYRACYESTHQERGPWSAVITAVVG